MRGIQNGFSLSCKASKIRRSLEKAISDQSFVLLLAVISVAGPSLIGQPSASTTDLKYQLPPDVIVKIVDAPPPPTLSISPAHGTGPRMILIQQSSSLPTIADLAEPELRLAGLRFNPNVGAPSRTRYFVSLKLQVLPLAGAGPKAGEIAIRGLPVKLHVLFAQWSPDGQQIVFVNVDDGSGAAGTSGLSLWIINVAKAHAARVPGVRLNAVLTEPVRWLNNGSLVALAVPADRGPVPVRSQIPTGPVVQENEGQTTPAPTYEDLLKSPTDENVFEYYSRSQIVEVKVTGGAVKKLGKPGLMENPELLT
jgi:hypothetical protein